MANKQIVPETFRTLKKSEMPQASSRREGFHHEGGKNAKNNCCHNKNTCGIIFFEGGNMPVTVKEDVKKLAEQLPDTATWDDVIRQVRVRRDIEAGLEDVRQGRVFTSTEVRKHFELKK